MNSSIPKIPKSNLLYIEIAQTIIIALLITLLIYIFIASPHQVDGKSMENTFHTGDLLLANKIIDYIGDTPIGDALHYDYKRGDIVIFQQSGKPDYIKRIIAAEGDRIKIENGSVYINDKKLKEEYIPDTKEYRTLLPEDTDSFLKEGEEKRVPSNKYFVMGDNRPNSQDSRFVNVGWVDRGDIKGKVFLRYWTPNKFWIVSRGKYTEE